jgi:hypothetical protein
LDNYFYPLALEKLANSRTDVFELRETAGIFQFYKLAEIKATELLDYYYRKDTKTKVA